MSMIRLNELMEILKGDSHFLLKCDKLWMFKNYYNYTERDMSAIVDISKSEIHRMLTVAKTDIELRIAVLNFKIDYHALCIYHSNNLVDQSELREKLLKGELKTHKQVRDYVQASYRKPRRLTLKEQVKLLRAEVANYKLLLESANVPR